jgi:hypothetical protein
VQEYSRFANPKPRECDINYLKRFQVASLADLFDEPPRRIFGDSKFLRIFIFTVMVFIIVVVSATHMKRPTSLV